MPPCPSGAITRKGPNSRPARSSMALFGNRRPRSMSQRHHLKKKEVVGFGAESAVIGCGFASRTNMSASKLPQLMCLDLHRAALLVWSTAHARALQEHTRIEWRPYRDSKVLNAVYGVLFWKEGPGTAEVRQDQHRIIAVTHEY